MTRRYEACTAPPSPLAPVIGPPLHAALALAFSTAAGSAIRTTQQRPAPDPEPSRDDGDEDAEDVSGMRMDSAQSRAGRS
ncbi:hypothetical protein B0H19DRAFT_1152501 [Mycena capillaripes]|nr:hypothetical protein B0H19DRAFT_1152501 [Mycena capillaripes]